VAVVAEVQVRRWPLLVFRGVTTAIAVLIFAQAALAGGFLSGNFEALAAHAGTGIVLTFALLAQTGVAILMWRKGNGPVGAVGASLAEFLTSGALIPLGEQRVLAVHVPLAVALTVAVAFVVAWSWRVTR
jgi:hypothetical protein